MGLPGFQSGLWNLVESSLRGRRNEVTGPHTGVKEEKGIGGQKENKCYWQG